MEAILDAPAPTEDQSDTLVVTDRCDNCGAQAFVGIVFKTGDLLLCGHHFAKSEDKIRSLALNIFDERWKLSDKGLDVSP
jgi:hypothetical protein